NARELRGLSAEAERLLDYARRGAVAAARVTDVAAVERQLERPQPVQVPGQRIGVVAVRAEPFGLGDRGLRAERDQRAQEVDRRPTGHLRLGALEQIGRA